MITYSAILLLAGKGERSCLPFNKVYAKIGEKIKQIKLPTFSFSFVNSCNTNIDKNEQTLLTTIPTILVDGKIIDITLIINGYKGKKAYKFSVT